MLSEIRYRLRALLRRHAVERDLDDELRFHLDQESKKYVDAGTPPDHAVRRARLAFGGLEGVKDECRDVRGIALIETSWRDLRYAIRMVRRAPAFAATIVLTIALGIGINTAAFTVFNAYLLRPIPVHDPFALYQFTWTTRDGRGHAFTWEEYSRFTNETSVFAASSATRHVATRINGRLAFGALVTRSYFQLLGVTAFRGRVLTSLDGTSEAGMPPLAVLSHAGWTALFGGDPEIVGKHVRIGGALLEVIGVTPDGFTGLGERPCDFWVPLSVETSLTGEPGVFASDDPGRLGIVGRLKPEIRETTAQAALAVWAAQATATRPDSERATGAWLMSLATRMPLPFRMLAVVLPIALAFVLVLLIACANVTNMLLSRAMFRHREIGVRLSLGASRSRLVRQLLIESVVLAVPAAAAGFAVAYGATHAGISLLLATMPAGLADLTRHLASLEPDVRVFGFSVVVAIASGFVFGLAPALQATKINVTRVFSGELVPKLGPSRMRSIVVVMQVTASVLLLICAALLLRGSLRLARIETGVNAHGVLDIEVREDTRHRILSTLGSSSLVHRIAATTTPVPFDGTPPPALVRTRERSDTIPASYRSVSGAYFAVLDIPVRAGRPFSAAEERDEALVAVVSQTAAQRLWPGERAVDKSLHIEVSENPRRLDQRRLDAIVRIIGVAGDIATGYSNDEAARTAIYLPTSERHSGTALLIRVRGDAQAAVRAFDTQLTTLQPGSVELIERLDEFETFRTYPFRVAYWISALLGSLAFLLTLSGIYGVLSYMVAMRSREIGIRMALGETTHGAARLVLGESMRLAAIGVCAGTAFGLGVSHVLASRLVMMNTYDPPAYAGAILVVLIGCAATAFFPALRAARIDPFTSLRGE